MTSSETTADASTPPTTTPGCEPRSGARSATVAIAAVTLLGLALRLAGARGDLWLDEIWSLDLVGGLGAPWEVFYRLAHDNNHFLNSFWLALVGPDHDVLLLRLPAVLLGAATVAASGRLGWRRSPLTGVITAFLFALAYPMVHYGSEARGYAGLLLATVVAIDAFERALDRPEGPDRWILGAAIGLGTLSHLTMVIPAATLGLAGLVHYARQRGSLRAGVEPTFVLFRPAEAMILPAALALGVGVVLAGGLTIGGVDPFALERLVEGYGLVLALSLGLPSAVHPIAVAGAAVAAAIAFATCGERRSTAMRVVVAAALVGIPLAFAIARLPNTGFPRYHLFSAVVLLIAAGDGLGHAIGTGGRARLAALVALALFVVGQSALLIPFLRDGRGGPSAIVATMTAAGPATWTGDHPFRNGMVVRRFDHDHRLREVAPDAPCDVRVDWHLRADFDHDAPPAPATVTLPAAGCERRFAVAATSPFFGLSGWRWTLYRAEP